MAARSVQRRLWRWAPGAFVFGFTLSLALFGGSGYAAPDNVQTAVYQWAAQHPGERVPVIVQTTGSASDVEPAVESTGGTVQRAFTLVDAVEARVPSSAVSSLAGDSSVIRISLDAQMQTTGGIDTKSLVTTYPFSVNANDPWGKGYTGKGVGIAVLDTGVTPLADFGPGSRLVANVATDPNATTTNDLFGHGTHVAGILGGYIIKGKYIGIAPESNIINVKVSDDQGNSSLGDLLAGLEYVYENRVADNIRVVNLSLSSSVQDSYKDSPLDAAVEALWFNGVFVVVAAGNNGAAADAMTYPPANDPFAMTVGAIDDRNTKAYGDDLPTTWTSRGVTQDGFTKPELLAPGSGLISTMAPSSQLYRDHPDHVVGNGYFSLSGTSMAAPVVSGLAALVIERHPDWTPGQLKCTLMATGRSLSAPYAQFTVPRAGAASNQSNPSCDSDSSILRSSSFAPMLKAGVIEWVLGQPDPASAAASIGLDLNAAGVDGQTLATVDWSAIKWASITWTSIKWAAIPFDQVNWDAIKWDAIQWADVTPDGVDLTAIKWASIKWASIKWDAIKWASIKWASVEFESIKWSAVNWEFTIE